MRVIKDKKIVDDNWQRLEEADIGEELPPGDLIIPFAYWRTHRSELLEREGQLGVCIDGDDETDEVAKDLKNFDLIALDFPLFKDGRGYSHARIIRDHYGYKGDLRAVGDVLRDQLFFMQRCGISSFHLSEGKDLEDALKGFSDFTVKYQTAADGAVPVYKQR
ncbi:MAG: hypothetical protein ACI9SC_000926 [Gammaproteobacteria bacterium]|jgi:uncharacterized protein (DUF934 family)